MRVATGIDVGHHTVRGVILERSRGGARIIGHAAVPRLDTLGEPKPVGTVVAELDAILKFRGEIVCADAGIGVLVRFVSTLPLPPERLQRLLRLELSQHADGSGDLAADTMVVPIHGEEMLHCCILAQPAQVYSTLVDLREAKVANARIHFAPVAAYNATLPLPPVRDAALALLVDIGAHTTGVTLYGEDRLLACRQITSGGDLFTEAMIAAGVDRITAEQAKRKVVADAPAPSDPASDSFHRMLEKGLEASLPEEPPASAAPADRSTTAHEEFVLFEDHEPGADHAAPAPTMPPAAALGPAASLEAPAPATPPFAADAAPTEIDVPAPVSVGASGTPAVRGAAEASRVHPSLGAHLDPALNKAADVLFGHIVSSLSFFKTQLKLPSLEVASVQLAGGAAGTPGLAAYLAKKLSMAVTLFDPQAGLALGRGVTEPHEWTTAIGLALSAGSLKQRGAVRLDLRPETLIKRELWATRLIWPYVAAALLIAGTVLSVLALHAHYSAEQESMDQYAAYGARYDSMKKKLEELDQQRVDAGKDLRAIASRIYSGRDLLEVLSAIKQRTEAEDSRAMWVTKLETRAVGQDAATIAQQLAHGDTVMNARAPSDATIDRGEVLIEGNVKFGSGGSLDVRQQFVKEWEDAIKTYVPPDGHARLFRDAVLDDSGESADRHAVGGGQSHWALRFFFAQTDLSLVTTGNLGLPER